GGLMSNARWTRGLWGVTSLAAMAALPAACGASHAESNGQTASVGATSPTAPPSVQTAVQGPTAPDGSVVWAYPYDGTVWPRGLLPPILQWNGGAATDDYYVHIVSPTFELQQFSLSSGAPASQIALD